MYLRNKKSSPKLLIIDDNRYYAATLCTVAAYLGFNANAIMPGPSVVWSILNADLLVLDLDMPGMNGIDVLHEMAIEKVPTKVLLLSGVCPDLLQQSKDQAREWGIDVVGCLSKPVRVNELKDFLKRSYENR
ncbi:response regulator [Porticoccus litoralis]|jgi:CheY-like chemotaxis protein|uniref:Response regulator n=1 Tax=Porticoccus litoralis TaxID=434086 RepID=A0AAW8B5G9_9GAMM|nr:response regulator [Porticoccus litoralis]MDP1521107.1 response regulator [Porticoccus litoralis]TNE85741.1 MAG: response regulator [Gammaproteobacteria bacterium]